MIGRLLDTALDRTVAPGYSRIGLAVRKRLPDWPTDPEPRALHDFFVWRQAMRSVVDFGAWEDVTRNLAGRDGEARPVGVAAITASGFRVAATPPLLGRALVPADERADAPADDFISVLAQAERAGVFTRHQVLVNTALLLFAGHETTMNLICNGTLAFIRHPDQWERLRAHPEGAARLATEECLRYDPPVKSTQRIATEDVERRGKVIRKGDRLRWFMAAANRDPRAFEDPDRFDIGRQPNTHVSFGAGIHYCLGASLARVEGQEVLRALAERFAELRLETEELEYSPSVQFRSLTSLPVAWD